VTPTCDSPCQSSKPDFCEGNCGERGQMMRRLGRLFDEDGGCNNQCNRHCNLLQKSRSLCENPGSPLVEAGFSRAFC
jgi:hypothetical protein